MTDPGLNTTPCEKCGAPGAISVRFFDEAAWHLLCPDCDKAEAHKRLADRDRAGWNVDAAVSKAYDYKAKPKMSKVVSVGGVPFEEYAKNKWPKKANKVQAKTRTRRTK